jgi:pyruvate/2-oxoglutarate dehydrogenase complex dihydrolipoamide dehydrogenase (E3) component
VTPRRQSGLYDLVVVGGGSAGLTASLTAARLGARVALVERDRPGGDCLFSGCVPSKALIRAARAAREVRRAGRFGVEASEPSVDFPRVLGYVAEVIDRIYERDNPDALRREGVEVILGHGRFVGPHALDVDGRAVRGRRVVVCTGSRPAAPPIPGLAEAPSLTYEDLFSLPALPARLLVLGAGPIGLEMAQAFGRLGSRVTLLQRSSRLLTVADPDCSRAIEAVLRAEGVDVRLEATVERVARRGAETVVTLADGAVAGDALLVAAGRRPNVDGLDLARAGVAYGPRGIPIDDDLRTNVPHIYAAGDVTGGPQFTHHAHTQAFWATRNALLPGRSSCVVRHVPWTVFTEPEVARVGPTEPEARARHGRDVAVTRLPLDLVDRAHTDDDRVGFVKAVHRRDGRLLGAHVVAARAGEMIQPFVSVLAAGGSLGDLARTVHVYPTYMMGVQQAAVTWQERRLLSGPLGRVIRAAVRLGR